MSAASIPNKARLTGLFRVAIQRQQQLQPHHHQLKAVATAIDSRAFTVLQISSSSSSSSSSSNNGALYSPMNNGFSPRQRWFSDNNANKNGSTKEDTTSTATDNGTSETGENVIDNEETTTTTATLDDTINVLETQVKELKDQLLRSLAEQENTRRIAQRDVESARQFAIKSFAKSLLDTADNLERALQVVDQEKLGQNNSSNNNSSIDPNLVSTLYEGIQMTHQGLLKAFGSHGLAKFGQVGEQFDPNQHAALYEYDDPSKTPGTVGQVVKPGFLLNKRVLRPAEVGVIKKPAA